MVEQVRSEVTFNIQTLLNSDKTSRGKLGAGLLSVLL